MKKLTKFLLIFSCVIMAFVSCSDEDDNPKPSIKIEEVKGDYTGKMSVNKKDGEAINVKVDKTISIAQFPVREIVAAIVDKNDLEQALKSLASVTYSVEHKAAASSDNILLALAPKALNFEITVKEKKQKIAVNFAAKAEGIFKGKDKTLAFSLKAESATLDGKKVATFKPIEYAFLPSKKAVAATVNIKDVEGTYSGKLACTQGKGTGKTEYTLSVTTKDKVLSFTELPIIGIVKSIVKDDKKTEEALKTIGKVKYDIAYTPVITAKKDAIELTLAPKTLEFEITVDGVKKKAAVTFAAKPKGVYTVKDKTLKFEMTADKITLDAKALEGFEVIKYEFPLSPKVAKK